MNEIYNDNNYYITIIILIINILTTIFNIKNFYILIAFILIYIELLVVHY